MAAHTHTCRSCGEAFHCGGHAVTDSDGVRVCEIEEGALDDPICEDCAIGANDIIDLDEINRTDRREELEAIAAKHGLQVVVTENYTWLLEPNVKPPKGY
jgi:hypothetical protein